MTTKTQKQQTKEDFSTKKADESMLLKSQLARALADYDNLKKRSNEERMDMYKFVSISFISKLLPILDNLRQAQEHLKDGGISIIISQLESLLKEDGFNEIKPEVGENFDESTSEVVDTIETEVKEDNNKISEIILTGWKFDRTVVRFAKVKVFKLKLESKKN